MFQHNTKFNIHNIAMQQKYNTKHLGYFILPLGIAYLLVQD